jgi:hypothetical protein
VLDLAGGGEVLGQLSVTLLDHAEIGSKGDRSDPARAGVEGEDELHRRQASQRRVLDIGWFVGDWEVVKKSSKK